MSNTPVRLGKPEKKPGETILSFLRTISEKGTLFLNQYAVLMIIICVILLFILIGMLFATLFIDTNVTIPSMMDSGNYYYHMKDVI